MEKIRKLWNSTKVLVFISPILFLSLCSLKKHWDRESWEEGVFFGGLYTIEMGELPSMYHREYVFNHHLTLHERRDAEELDSVVLSSYWNRPYRYQWDSCQKELNREVDSSFRANILSYKNNGISNLAIIEGENNTIYISGLVSPKNIPSIRDNDCTEYIDSVGGIDKWYYSK